jgi:hypothetical protein
MARLVNIHPVKNCDDVRKRDARSAGQFTSLGIPAYVSMAAGTGNALAARCAS